MFDPQPRRPVSHFRGQFAAFVAAVVCAVGTVLAVASPAHAAASGTLLHKHSGSLYQSYDVVNFGIIPGGDAKTVGVKVVNTGIERQQFKLAVNAGPNSSATLFVGSTAVRSPFYTPYVAPGGSLALSVKIQVAPGVPPASYTSTIELRDPETDQQLSIRYMSAQATYQAGNTRNDLFLKTGTQPYVGGSTPFQTETANALKVGNIATFKLRLQNNGWSPASMSLHVFAYGFCFELFPFTVKQGATDVTNAVRAGSYTTGPLAPGAKKELTVTFKRVAGPDFCQSASVNFHAQGPDGGTTQTAHLVTAA